MSAPRSPRRRRFDDEDGWEAPARQHLSTPATFERDGAAAPGAQHAWGQDPEPGTFAHAAHEHLDDNSSDEVVDARSGEEPAEADEPNWSTWVQAAHGPDPIPRWVVTDPTAIDTDHGVLKSGKEADVSLVERRVPGGPFCLLAAKRYRSAAHRMFHRDAGYQEGRRHRKSREIRAMATRTQFGRDLLAQQWSAAEFDVLTRLWRVGAAVPYPVQLLGTELMIEFIGDASGVAAPRLAQLRPGSVEGRSLYAQMVEVLRLLADAGYAHGDLSPYNVLVHEGRIVLIDLPQAVDLVGNPQGFDYLRRDCANICSWFSAQGVRDADPDDLVRELLRSVPGLG